jgi:hypothetical protein
MSQIRRPQETAGLKLLAEQPLFVTQPVGERDSVCWRYEGLEHMAFSVLCPKMCPNLQRVKTGVCQLTNKLLFSLEFLVSAQGF